MSDDQIREIKGQLKKVLDDQKRLLDALLGDEAMGYVGMVARVENVETTVNEIQQERRDEKAEKEGAWKIVTLISAAVGTLAAWAVDYFTKK